MLAYQDGAPAIPGLYPAEQAAVLAWVEAASGVPDPANLSFNSVPLVPANTTVTLLSPNPARTFLLIYNPTQMVAQFSKGIATQGAITNLSIGPGQAYFSATAQGLGPVYQGAVTAVGLYAPLPLWVWEDSLGFSFYDDGGVLALNAAPPNWPTDPTGLPPGSIWSNGLTIGVVDGITPNIAAAPVFFGSITPSGLLELGGGNLPTSNPGLGQFQLWNDGGMIAIDETLLPPPPPPPTPGLFTLDQSTLDGPDVLAPTTTGPFTLDQSNLGGPDELT